MKSPICVLLQKQEKLLVFATMRGIFSQISVKKVPFNAREQACVSISIECVMAKIWGVKSNEFTHLQ